MTQDLAYNAMFWQCTDLCARIEDQYDLFCEFESAPGVNKFVIEKYDLTLEFLKLEVDALEFETGQYCLSSSGELAKIIQEEQMRSSGAWKKLLELRTSTQIHFGDKCIACIINGIDELMLWTDTAIQELSIPKKASTLKEVKRLIHQHQSLKVEILKRQKDLSACCDQMTDLMDRGHYASDIVKSSYQKLKYKFSVILGHWEKGRCSFQLAFKLVTYQGEVDKFIECKDTKKPYLMFDPTLEHEILGDHNFYDIGGCLIEPKLLVKISLKGCKWIQKSTLYEAFLSI